MSIELFSSPNQFEGVRKFIRVYNVIYVGPVDIGHQEIADSFGVDAQIKRIKIQSRADVDGGFVEVLREKKSVIFDNASGTYGLGFDKQARENTVRAALSKGEGYDISYKKLENDKTSDTKQNSSDLDLYDREGELFSLFGNKTR